MPPFDTPRTPDNELIEGEVVADNKPFVAWTNPLREVAKVVAPLTVNVPVAVRFPPRKVFPETSKRFDGDVVPIPTFPVL